jgi:hypothetical protein
MFTIQNLYNIPPISPFKIILITCSQMVPIVRNYLFLSQIDMLQEKGVRYLGFEEVVNF